MTKSPEVILLHETAGLGWLRDLSTFMTFVGLIGIGVFLDSQAMQWIGALLGFIAIIARANRVVKDNRLSIPEARKRLDEIERGQQ